MIQRADKTTLSLFALIVLIIMIISFQYTPIFGLVILICLELELFSLFSLAI